MAYKCNSLKWWDSEHIKKFRAIFTIRHTRRVMEEKRRMNFIFFLWYKSSLAQHNINLSSKNRKDVKLMTFPVT